MRGTDVLFAASLATLLVGRVAVAEDDEAGTLFYVVAPLAFALGLALLVLAVRLAEPLRGVLYPLAGAVLGFVFAAVPDTQEGGIALGFLLGGGCLAVLALLQSRELVQREPRPSGAARALPKAVAFVAALLAISAVVIAVGMLVLLIALSGDG